MKCIGKIGVCLVGGLALNASLSAAAAVPSNNPYEPIVARNVFDLNPPQVVVPTTAEPPVKITPNGIMTIFGKRQVLFKVNVPPERGMPPKEDDYILGEGQRQDDIEVTRIDEKSGVITFNNHGVVQEIPLTVAPAITTSLPASVAENRPDSGRPGGNFGRRFGGGGRFGRNSAVGGGGNNNFNGANNDSNLRSVPTRQPEQQIDPDQQIIMIEAERELHKNDSDYPPLPLTEVTPPEYIGPNGGSLANPSTSASEK
jgi:hypothetical protein